ncbi:6-phosphogluconolactonase [Nioella nitratireducens]|uniref:6-phosphogluconolactonase n=1 Tax=Nioella nitratireducens TaxID=1287720 RepID=UPI0008FD6E8D|nr:6-phosphogluconolactonase [Nioella nitratireducens]
MNLIKYPDREMMMLDLADALASELADHLRRHDQVSFCVPGGTTPGPIFDVLSEQALDWNRVTVFLSDERWVPADNPRSNTGLIRDRLLVSKAARARFAPLYAAAPQPEDMVDDLGKRLEPYLPITLLLLGMGADMHTASLFPGADRLADALADDAPILVPMRGGGAPEPRVTLSARVLADAVSTHIVIAGDEKREALERAQRLPVAEAPVRAVLSGATVHWAP